MSAKPNINQNVKDLIDNIIKNYKLDNDSNVSYSTGSELGDGFLSQALAITISDKNQSLALFIKCCFDEESSTSMAVPIHNFFGNEIHFYDVVLPTYLKFVEEKNVKDGFRNIPKCYGTSKKLIIALENLKEKNYVLCNKRKPLNDEHITLVLKTYAKFHAISFAYKDQHRNEYNKLIEPTLSVFEDPVNDGMKRLFRILMKKFLSGLDPTKDKHILDRTDFLVNKLCITVEETFRESSDATVLTHGDSWCNNMMFLYKDENKEHPVDIILVDWQIIHQSLPIVDLAYFFYTVAPEEALDNFRYYLKVYHEELSSQIRKLGSDPDILYPFSLLEKQWKEKSKFGLYMAFLIIRIMLSEVDETFDFTNVDYENAKAEDIVPTLKNNREYSKRIKAILEHMITNDFI